ncbi:MAG: hypothetical protein ACE5D8_09010 [Fidelibacterota bacterium]
MIRNLIGLILFFGVMSGQPYVVGDVVADFQQTICENGNGSWSLYNSTGFDGNSSGRITLLIFFASW